MTGTGPFGSLGGTLHAVWEGLEQRNGPWATPVFATADRMSGPAARIVVLREALRAEGRLVFWTHAASGKIGELRADPRAEALIWDAPRGLQVRLGLHVSIRPGGEEDWRRLGPGSRLNYGLDPAPGEAIDDPGSLPRPESALFARLDCTILAIETLWICDPPHRRARFRAETGWRGSWIAP